MPKRIKFEGKIYVVPDDATEDEISEIVGGGDTSAGADKHAAPVSTPQPSLLKTAVSAAPGIIGDLATGAGKGVLDSIVGAGEMVHKVPGVSSLVDAAYGTPGLSANAFPAAHAELAPTSRSQQLGKLGADVGMMAVAPEGGIPAKMTASGLMAGAQTGGNPYAMAGAAALAGGGELAGRGISKLATMTREGQAAPVARLRTTRAAKAAGESIDDPMWMEAMGKNREAFIDMIKQYGLTGGKNDIAIIKAAPTSQQEVLSALSNQLGKPKPFSHVWSTLAALSELPAMAAGHGAEGLGIALPLMGMGLAGKYPGMTAKVLDATAEAIPSVLRGTGGVLPGRNLKVDPMTQALFDRENP